MPCLRSEVRGCKPYAGDEQGQQREDRGEPLGSGPRRSIRSSPPVKLGCAAGAHDSHAVVSSVAALPAPGIQHPVRLADVDLPALSEFKSCDRSSATIAACHRLGVAQISADNNS